MTEEQQQLVIQNHNLIYYYLHSHKLPIEEYYDIAAIGLCRAAISYDPAVAKFTTYALRCIECEMQTLYRRQCAQKRIPATEKLLSLEEVHNREEGTGVTFENLAEDCFRVEDAVVSSMLFNEFWNSLCDRDQVILHLMHIGYTLSHIGEILQISQPSVSRRVAIMKAEFKKLLGLLPER